MNTTHRTARVAAVLLATLVSWAIAAPLASGAASPRPRTPKARTPQVRWYRWHPTARQLHTHYGSKVVIGLESMQDFKALRGEYGFDRGTAHEIPALHAVLVKVGDVRVGVSVDPRRSRARFHPRRPSRRTSRWPGRA